MLGILLVGIGSGLAAMIVSLAMGHSFWMALLAYSLFGALALFLTALTRVAMVMLPAWDGSGSEFEIEKEEASALATAVRPAARRGGEGMEEQMRTMRILAVDDDPFIRELLPRIAAEVGFPDVTAAASGPEALDLLTYGGRVYDCLLLDINMPEMDGIELCLKIREMAAYRDTPIIMLTAMRDMKNMDDAFSAGATDYATKPFDILDLATRLKAANLGLPGRDSTGAEHAGSARGAAEAAGRGSERQADVQIEGVTNLIEYRALANYILRLPRPEAGKVAVFAVRIEQHHLLEARAHPGQMLTVLREIAQSIGAVLGTSGGANVGTGPGATGALMAYAGAGTFLVATRHGITLAGDPEMAINLRLARLGAEAGLAADEKVTVAVGELIQTGGTRTLRAETAFRRALTSVQDRMLFKEGQALSALRQIGDRSA